MTVRHSIALVLTALVAAGACTPTHVASDAARTSATLSAGDPAPAFTLPTADGGKVESTDFVGRPVLLYFSMGPG